MRAIVMDDYGPVEVLRMTEIDIPAVKAGEVRIRVSAAAVNPADVKWRAGMFRDMVPLTFPHILGYDIAGIVDAVGEGVSAFTTGDRVAAMLDPVTKGGYAQWVNVPATVVATLPDTLDLVTAAALPTAGLTGVQLVEEHLKAEKGQTILVTGACGAVGRFAVYAALRRGVHVVAAVRASQAEEARQLGAHEVIILGEQNWAGKPFDHVADTVGGEDVAALCRHVAPGGLIRTAATTPVNPAGLSTTPEFFAVHADAARLAELARDVAAGLVTAPIAQRLPLAQAADAHRLVEAGGLGGKVILEP